MTSSRILPFSSAKPSATGQASTTLHYGSEPFCFNGPSPAMARIWSLLQRVAPYFRTAMLTGEPGTGAEFAARALHDASPFRERPLHILSAIAAEHYFVGSAPHSRNGGHGAFFVEEAEKLSATAQRGLLHLVRLRGPRTACVIVFARTDLRALVSNGSFSAELAMALRGLRIALPPLRERREDIPILAQAIVNRTAERLSHAVPRLHADFLEAACDYAWPRNLDQMGDMISWLMSHKPGMSFRRDDFEAACAACEPKQEAPLQPVRLMKLEDMVQEHIRAVLLACNGNKQRAAEVLGISRSTLYRMLDAASPLLLQCAG
jgi:DNA-binding NtrC family response regulator